MRASGSPSCARSRAAGSNSARFASAWASSSRSFSPPFSASSSLKSRDWSPSSWYWSFSAIFAFSSSTRSASTRLRPCSGVSADRGGAVGARTAPPPCFEGRSADETARSAERRPGGGTPIVVCMKVAISPRSCDTSANERFPGSNRWSWAPDAKSRTSR